MLIASAPVALQGQAAARSSDTTWGGLSDSARVVVTAYRAAPDSVLRLRAVQRMDSTALPVLLTLIPGEPSAWLRALMVRNVGWRFAGQLDQTAAMRTTLKAVLATDPDSTVVAAALENLMKVNGAELRALVDQRIGPANLYGDGAPVPAWLQVAQERAIAVNRGWVLPLFLRTPPPLFAAAPAKAPIRVLAFGDWGTGLPQQLAVAAAARAYHQHHPFSFAITLGDNFYTEGLPSPTHERWQTQYETLYSPMGIPFYPSLGNHDVVDGDSPAAEIIRSYVSPTWRLPAEYYTFTAGAVQFFALNTNDLSARQLTWLKAALEQSSARWKVVYGHFPVDIATATPINPGYAAYDMRRKLLPMLRGRADVYISGHHHSTQHLKPVDGVNLFIAGSGGTAGYASDSTAPNALFARTTPGFTVLEADAQSLTVRFLNDHHEEMYHTTLHKPAP